METLQEVQKVRMKKTNGILILRYFEFCYFIISTTLLVVMMVLVASHVAGRYLLNQPIQGTHEITEFIMVAIVFLSLSHTQAKKAHIKIELFTSFLPLKMTLILEIFVYVLGFTIFALIAWQGYLAFLESWVIEEVTLGYLALPLYPAKLTIPLGCAVLCFRFIADIFSVFQKR